jgi:hypothetical protein
MGSAGRRGRWVRAQRRWAAQDTLGAPRHTNRCMPHPARPWHPHSPRARDREQARSSSGHSLTVAAVPQQRRRHDVANDRPGKIDDGRWWHAARQQGGHGARGAPSDPAPSATPTAPPGPATCAPATAAVATATAGPGAASSTCAAVATPICAPAAATAAAAAARRRAPWLCPLGTMLLGLMAAAGGWPSATRRRRSAGAFSGWATACGGRPTKVVLHRLRRRRQVQLLRLGCRPHPDRLCCCRCSHCSRCSGSSRRVQAGHRARAGRRGAHEAA